MKKFPANAFKPQQGYLEQRIDDSSSTRDATRLKFGSFSGRMIPVSITLCIDFSYEGNKDYGVVPLQLNTVLELSPLRPFSWVQRDLGDDPKRLTEAIRDLVNLGDYCEPVLDGKTIAYEPKG